jgi:hypothetical protein
MAARRLTVVLDAMPVVLLAVIAGAGSFTHIRDTAAQHGQHGPMSWPIAVSVDLTCVMAARERQRDQRLAIATGRISWPAAVLAGGVLLSLSANLAQAQPTTWAGSWPPPRARHSWSRFPCSNAAPPPGDRPPTGRLVPSAPAAVPGHPGTVPGAGRPGRRTARTGTAGR